MVSGIFWWIFSEDVAIGKKWQMVFFVNYL